MSRAAARSPGRRVRARRAVTRLLRSRSGVSAVEFALLAPVLVLMALATADAGMAIYQKMMIGQVLRAGAQMALLGTDQDGIRSVLEEVARKNFTLAGETATGDALAITVSSYCGCPGEAVVQISCTGVCDSGLAPADFYDLAASKSFQGIILPSFTISGSLDVMAQ